ncbi:MAG: hypothetical protein JST89_14040 [Cyanobacteria bacterium SZAS-4]|nr:hypothetical protein [Cyanobacteria bacterium SZAS-4]
MPSDMQPELDSFFERNFGGSINNISISELRNFVSLLQVPFVRTQGRVFSSNVEATDQLLSLPINLALFPSADKAINEWINTGWNDLSFGDAKALIEEATSAAKFFSLKLDDESDTTLAPLNPSDKLWIAVAKAVEFVQICSDWQGVGLSKNIKVLLRPVLEKNTEWLVGFEQLFRNSVSSLWTAFEILSGDLWEHSVNSHPEVYAHGALFVKKDTIGMSGKNIHAAVLQQHNFNLSAVMGTILREKYSFTSFRGVRDAYSGTFNSDPFANLDPEFEKKMVYIAQCRHLIQHKMGIVDADFLANTGANLKVGDRLSFTIGEVLEYADTVISASRTLLTFVDESVVRHSPVILEDSNEDIKNKEISEKPSESVADFTNAFSDLMIKLVKRFPKERKGLE